MLALTLTAPRKLELMEVDEPRGGGNNLLIKVSACGICGSDLHYWEMGTGMDGSPGLIPGHEFCGTILDAGTHPELSPGDRVTCIPLNPCGECGRCAKGLYQLCRDSLKRPVPGNNAPGAFAEQLEVRSDLVRKLPPEISDEEACLVEPAAVAFHAVRQADISLGDRVLIIGGGPVGLLGAAWAYINGAGLVGLCEINTHRLAFAENFGYVQQVFDAGNQKLKKNLKQFSGGGFDAVVETSAADPGIATGMSALEVGGTMVLAGINYSPQALSTLTLTTKELNLKGSMAYSLEEFDAVIKYIAEKRVELRKVVNRLVKLEEVPAVFEEIHSGDTEIIKAVCRP